jgi:hypothetical protein
MFLIRNFCYCDYSPPASEQLATPMDIQTRFSWNPGVHKFSRDLVATLEFYKFHSEDPQILGATVQN